MPTIAVIGSREISAAERAMIRQVARWCARRGFHGRSGGANGADDAWEDGWASVEPALFTVASPDERTRRTGVHVERPPYPEWVVERAVAEWTFGERLSAVGLPPYDDPSLQARFEARSSWRWLEEQEMRRRARDPGDVQVTPDDAYVQRLMIRNARIICPEEAKPVDLVLGLLGPRRGGGGTGHAFRLAAALGVPTYDLRDPHQQAEARTALEALTPTHPRGRSR